MRTCWLFGPIAWNQSKGLILSRSSCSGQKRQYWNIFWGFLFSIDTAWIYKTVQLKAVLPWELCLKYNNFYASNVSCPRLSTVCKETIAEQQVTKDITIARLTELNCMKEIIALSNIAYQWAGQSKWIALFVILFCLICYI